MIRGRITAYPLPELIPTHLFLIPMEVISVILLLDRFPYRVVKLSVPLEFLSLLPGGRSMQHG